MLQTRSPLLSRDRRFNMRPRNGNVKRAATTYCAFLLGQSQDVDACGKRPGHPLRPSLTAETSHPRRPTSRFCAGGRMRVRGRWEAVFRPPPWCTGRMLGGLSALPQNAGGTRLPIQEQAKCHGSPRELSKVFARNGAGRGAPVTRLNNCCSHWVAKCPHRGHRPRARREGP